MRDASTGQPDCRTHVPVPHAGTQCAIANPSRGQTVVKTRRDQQRTRRRPATSPRAIRSVGWTHSLAAVHQFNEFRESCSGLKSLARSGARAAGRSPRPCTPCHRTDTDPGRRKGQPHQTSTGLGRSQKAASAAARRRDGLGLLGRGYSKRGLGREPRVPPQSLEVAVSIERCVIARRETKAGEAAAVSRKTSQPDEGRARTTLHTTSATASKKT